MRKKNFIFLPLFAYVIIAFASLIYNTVKEETCLSDLQLSNIEALTQEEEDTRTCTIASQTCTCYSKNGFCGLAILSVEHYTVTSVVESCSHDHVTSCACGSCN